ncbi:MAG: hypothetical protein CME21_05800 [Gemmatimonadetes bacterium]|jgi:hypothetical protein|nr:hypothetical protein [Gemmatimonadota bacterium]HCK09019.1 hypothetical protein [Candidatus Latescibacterota bacterium]
MRRVGSMSPVVIGLLFCTGIGADAATLNGRVRNVTLGRVEVGVPVQLVHHSAQSVEVLADTTNAEGRFSFELPGEPSAEVPMMLSAEYDDVQYRSNRVTDSNAPVEIAVYESAGDDAVIEVISHHLIVDAQSRQMTQILIFQNTSDRTFKTGTGHGHGIEVPMPEGVSEVSSEIPGVHTHGPILVDSRPVPPGRMQLAFTTPIPGDGRVIQRLKYGAPSIDAFITPVDAEVTDNSMQDLGLVNIGERQFRRLVAEQISLGGQVSFKLTGSVAGSPRALSGEFDPSRVGPWALGGVALGALIALIYLKTGSSKSLTIEEGEDLGPAIRRSALIQQIADLDDRLETGYISVNEHERRRDALKAEVVDLTKATTG